MNFLDVINQDSFRRPVDSISQRSQVCKGRFRPTTSALEKCFGGGVEGCWSSGFASGRKPFASQTLTRAPWTELE
jgi:hypothetical protein